MQLSKEVFFKGVICAKQIDIRDRSIVVHHSSSVDPSASPLAKFGFSEDDLLSGDTDDLNALPTAYALEQNYPNPFNPTTTIRIALPEAGNVTLEIYNMLGQKVRTLISGSMEAGYHQIQWDGANDVGQKVASGIYLYRIQAGEFRLIKRMILMK